MCYSSKCVDARVAPGATACGCELPQKSSDLIATGLDAIEPIAASFLGVSLLCCRNTHAEQIFLCMARNLLWSPTCLFNGVSPERPDVHSRHLQFADPLSDLAARRKWSQSPRCFLLAVKMGRRFESARASIFLEHLRWAKNGKDLFPVATLNNIMAAATAQTSLA